MIKRAREAPEVDSSNSTAMHDIAAQRPPEADTPREPSMRDSSKRQANVGVEELEWSAHDSGNAAATIGDDIAMGVESQGGAKTRPVRCRCRGSAQQSTSDTSGSSDWIERRLEHGHHLSMPSDRNLL